MNILLINHYAGSTAHGMEYRPFYLAREWVRMGHQVTIVAASYSHLRAHQPAPDHIGSSEEIEGIRYLWLPTPSYNGNGAARARNIFTFVTRLYLTGKRLSRQYKPDVVVASSTYPLDSVPARHISRCANAKLVYEVHDLWPLSPVELGGMSPRHPFIRVMQWAENYACSHADKVVSMLPKAEGHLCEHGLRPGQFIYIPNGVDAQGWRSTQTTSLPEAFNILSEKSREGCFIIGYAGAHGVANALDSFVLSGTLLADTNVILVLVGQGPEKERLQRLASSQGITNVAFLPSVTREAVPNILAQMDGLFISLQRTPLFRFGISPNKLMDYMMAGKPIIQAIDAGNDHVAESGCGLTVAPEDPHAIADGIRRLMALSPAERKSMGQRGKEYVLAHHDYSVLAKRFLEAI